MIVVKYINGIRCVYKKKKPLQQEYKIIESKVSVPKTKDSRKEQNVRRN